MLTVETMDEAKNWEFEKANFKLKRLTDIKNSEDLKMLAKDLCSKQTWNL